MGRICGFIVVGIRLRLWIFQGLNRPIGKPFSLGCQIMELENFNEIISILNKLGLKGGFAPENNPSKSWCMGDKIKITIKSVN